MKPAGSFQVRSLTAGEGEVAMVGWDEGKGKEDEEDDLEFIKK